MPWQRLARLIIRREEKMQMAISQNSLEAKCLEIFGPVRKQWSVYRKEETGHIPSGKSFAFLESPHKVLPQRDTTVHLPYLPYTHTWQCTNPCPHRKSSPIDAPSLRPLAQPRN